MGSDKYPTENDFDAYLSQRGGQSNAWTGNEFTVFHFDAQRRYFPKCLDRFANFFISPLLNQDSSDRELAAVHSEFDLNNAKDSARLRFFIGTLASLGSPYRIFGFGNVKSLREIPEDCGTDIHKLLQEHRRTTYSSHRMTLAIQSKDSLNNLESLVRGIFSEVPNSGVCPPDFSSFTNCFDAPLFNKIHWVCPLGDREKLRLVWALPPLRDSYKSAPLGVLFSLMGHEGQGSVLACLKEKNLAVSLACGSCPYSDFENPSFCSLFIIFITLTKEGLMNVNEVYRIVFSYLRLLLRSASDAETPINQSPNTNKLSARGRVVHTFHSYLLEYRQTRESAFLFCEPGEPEDSVVHVASMMQLVPPEHVYSAHNLLKEIDMQLYIKILKLLVPERVSIIILSSKFASSLTPGHVLEIEPWFKIRYKSEDLPYELFAKWNQLEPDESLHMPLKNIYLTSNFSLLPALDDMKVPVDLNASPGAEHRLRFGHLWFQQNTRFKSPKASFTTHLWSPIVTKSKENVALHMLLNYGLNQTLSTIAYEGGEANLSYSLEYTESGLKICLNGFSDKLFCFYQTILDHIVNDAFVSPEAHFDSYRDAIRQLCINEAFKPEILNTHLQFYLLRKESYLFDDLLFAIQRLSVADLLAYKQQFFSQLHITAYVHGNLTAEDAVNYFEYTTRKIGCAPFPRRTFTDVPILSAGRYQLKVINCNPVDVNLCVAHVHLLGRMDVKRSAYNQLLAYLLSEPAFDFLRTKETLGYHVFLRDWCSSPGGNQHGGISLVACSQANKFSASYVSGRLTAFWCRIAPLILASMSTETFQTSVGSLISIKRLEDPNMLTEVDRNWKEILLGEAMFNRREACVDVLNTIQKEDLLNFFYTEYLKPNLRKSLVIQVDAPSHVNVDSVFPSKECSISIRHVKMNDDCQQQEEKSMTEVDANAAVTACGYDADTGTAFLRTFNPNILNPSLFPDAATMVRVDDVRQFRSKLMYDPGRII